MKGFGARLVLVSPSLDSKRPWGGIDPTVTVVLSGQAQRHEGRRLFVGDVGISGNIGCRTSAVVVMLVKSSTMKK